MNWRTCRAAFMRADCPGEVLFFGGPGEVITGGWRDWGLIKNTLARQRKSQVDGPCPPGGLAGVMGYDGRFVFHVCPEVKRGTPEEWVEGVERTGTDVQQGEWSCRVQAEDFAAMVREAQEWISRGEIYQVNLARMLEWKGSPVVGWKQGKEFFSHLWSVTEAPLAGWVGLPDGWLATASPELFLSIQGREIMTRPIKGTRPRDRDPAQDSRNALELSTSPKEVAELVMITDLERNDLGQICCPGTVEVTSLAARESFSHVHHLVSTVVGELRSDVDAVDAVRACFPGGSITGAPKRRAMEAIARLEPAPRGYYTGAAGWFGFDGSVQLNIVIRAVEAGPCGVRIGVGSGITADSDPLREFEETEHKAAAMLQAWKRWAGSARLVSAQE